MLLRKGQIGFAQPHSFINLLKNILLHIIRKILKILAWVAGSLVALLLLVFLLLQVPAVQNYLKDKAVAYLEKKIGTRVEVAHLSIGFPKKVVLEGIYFEDRKKDTLLSGERIAVDISMLKLLQSAVVVQSVELEGIHANIYRKAPDTVFNYQYIIDAFASPSKTEVDTSGGMRFDVDRISLRRVVASYVDDQEGMNLYASIGKFNTRFREFDPDKLRFAIPEIALENSRAVIRQYKPLIEAPKSMAEHKAESSEPIQLALKLGKVDLKGIDFDYENTLQDVSAKLQLGAFGAQVDSLDLGRLHIALDKLALSNTTGIVRFGPTPQAQMVAEEAGETVQATVENPWKLLINDLGITNVAVKFDNDAERRVPYGIDYAHLDVKGLLLDGENMAFTPARFEGTVDRAELTEQNSRFQLRNLRTAFLYNDSGVVLNDLYLETDKTILRDRIQVGWPSLDALDKNPGVMLLVANLRNSRVAIPDVLTFAPMLRDVPPFQKAPNAVYAINDLQLAGRLSDLRINVLDLAGLEDTRVRLAGTIKGLPDPDRAVFNLNITQLRTTNTDFDKFLPPNTLPPDIRIPEKLALTGNFTGRIADFRSNFALTTNRGNARGVLAMRNFGDGGYMVDATTQGLNLGYILKQEATIGAISAHAQATGRGFDPKTGVANFKAQVYGAFFNGYNYKGVDVSGNLQGGIVKAKGVSRDPNVATTFDVVADLRGKDPALAGKVNLTALDLQALHFTTTPFRVDGLILADVSKLDPDNPIGTVLVQGANLNVNGQKFNLDTVSVDALQTVDSGYMVRIRSEILTANMWGNYAFTQVGPSVMNLIDRYYHLPGYKPTPARPQDFVLTATIQPSLLPILMPIDTTATDSVLTASGFIPTQIKGSAPIDVYTAFNSAASLLDAQVKSPRIIYGPNRVDSLSLVATTKDTAALRYNLNVASAKASSLNLYQTSLRGAVANDLLTFKLDNRDAANVSRYVLSGNVMASAEDAYRLSLSRDTVLLNYQAWTVPDSNYLEYSPAGIVAKDFAFASGNQSFGAYSQTLSPKAPLDLRFRNFRISTITDFVGQDSLNIEGFVNGYASLQDLSGDMPQFSSDLRIDSISYNRDTLGTILVQADNATEDAITANVALNGYGNDMRLNGVYYIAGQKVDMNLNIGNLNLEKLPALSAGQIAESGGSLKGSIDVLGTLNDPDVNGSLHFDSAFFTPTMLGARLYIPSDNIFVTPKGVRFDRFTFLDSAGHEAVIDGRILTSDFKKYRFDLRVNADSFLIANATRRPGSDQLFYGRLNVSADTRIAGSLNAPDVSGNIRINEGTDFKVLLPSTNPEVDAGVGVVKFVDEKNHVHTVGQKTDTLTARTEVSGVDVDLAVQTDSMARFTVVIDERNGDALSVRGVSNLGVGMDRSGKFTLTGAYQLQEGSYLLTLNFLRRQFNIQHGSTITWTGEPTDARVDITATYTANTSPIDLVVDQLAGSPQNELNRYKQRLPFEVDLKMTGELMKPVISFDIQLPDRTSSQWDVVKARLAQLRANESELNKQVFALLLLNRFVSETPLKDYGDNGGLENYARQSASRLLTDQLNRIAGSLIKGVDLNVGVNSSQDYSTGTAAQRTDVTVGLSKRLLNDRLRVNVGSNFEVEGPKQANESATQIASDISIEYQLTKDGRYQLRTYRRNQYTDVVAGQVIETGAGIGASISYDRFREIFQSADKTRRQRLQKRARARDSVQ